MKFRQRGEFRNELFNHTTYRRDWRLPTSHLSTVQELMQTFAVQVVELPFAPPAKQFPYIGPPASPPTTTPDIKIELGGRHMPEFHPILANYFEYGTTSNRLDHEGAVAELGDDALELACSELADSPSWAVIRNMSDPVIIGDLPAKQFHLKRTNHLGRGHYTAYGEWTSVLGSLATWGVIVGLTLRGAANLTTAAYGRLLAGLDAGDPECVKSIETVAVSSFAVRLPAG